MSDVTLNQIILLAKQLSPEEKMKLRESLDVELTTNISKTDRKSLETFYGICADLGPAPSDEDIAEVRREMLKNFPKDIEF